MPDTKRYIKAWKVYKNNKRIFIVLLLCFYPVLEWVVRPIYIYYGKDLILHIYGLAWIIFIVVYSTKIVTFTCPRCGKYFSEKWHGYFIGYLGFRLNKCVYCGLPQWSLGDQNDAYENS
jgi:Na+/melibiose symporter-like transporter